MEGQLELWISPVESVQLSLGWHAGLRAWVWRCCAKRENASWSGAVTHVGEASCAEEAYDALCRKLGELLFS